MFKKLIYKITTSPKIKFSLFGGILFNIFNERDRMMYKAMKYAFASKLEGGYFEFGSHLGKSMISAYHLSKRFMPNIIFYAFDSFEGLPEENSMKDESKFQQFKSGEFTSTEERFRSNLKKSGVNMSRVHTFKGWYRDVLNKETMVKIKDTKAAVVNIDCDLYESTVTALDFLVPYLQDGTLILFDDWFTYRGDPDRGEQKAFKEWLERNPNIKTTQYHKYAWAGNSFIIHLKKN